MHIAPGCGAEDFELGQKLDLQNIIPVDEDGVFYNNFGFLSGLEAMSVADLIFEELTSVKCILHININIYPICWRCKDSLPFRLTKEWYIKADKSDKTY